MYRFGEAETSLPIIGSDGVIYIAVATEKSKQPVEELRDLNDNPHVNIIAINPDGTRKWTFGKIASGGYGETLGADGTLYYPGKNALYAIGRDGKEKWRYPLKGIARGVAAGHDGSVYVTDYDYDFSGGQLYRGQLYVLDKNGRMKWTLPLEDLVTTLFPSKDGTVYLEVKRPESGDHQSAGDQAAIKAANWSTLYAYDASGKKKWEREIVARSGGSYVAVQKNRILLKALTHRETQYLKDAELAKERNLPESTYLMNVSESYRDALISLRLDGTEEWSADLGDGGWFPYFHIEDGETAFVAGAGGRLLAYGSDGKKKWSFKSALPIGADKSGTLYVASEDVVYALNRNGTEKWNFKKKSASPPVPRMDRNEGLLYLGPDFDSAKKEWVVTAVGFDGKYKWAYRIKGSRTSASEAEAYLPMLYPGKDGTIIIVLDNTFYAVTTR